MLEQPPTLSVVISCRNSAATLGELLDSIVGQRYANWWEVVIVDNGSTDNTAEVARSYDTLLPNLSVLSAPNPAEQATGLNYGVHRSTGEVVVFLDSDDVIGEDYLLHMGRALATADIAGASIDILRLNRPAVRRRRRPLQLERIETFKSYLPAVVGAALAIRRPALEEVGGFDEELPTQHDLDVSWRLYRAGHLPVFVPGAVLHYRYREGPRAIFRQEYNYGRGEVLLYAKHRAHGQRRRSFIRSLASCGRLGIALVTLPRPGGAARFATLLGAQLGRIRGSVEYRVWYP